MCFKFALKAAYLLFFNLALSVANHLFSKPELKSRGTE